MAEQQSDFPPTDAMLSGKPGTTEAPTTYAENEEVLETVGEPEGGYDAVIARGEELAKKLQEAPAEGSREKEARKPPTTPQPKDTTVRKGKGKAKGMLRPDLFVDNPPPSTPTEDAEITKAAMPKYAPPMPESSPGSDEWADTVEAGGEATPQPDDKEESAAYGMHAPVLSVASSHAQDLRNDVDTLATQWRDLTSTVASQGGQIASLHRVLDEIKAANAQFHTDLLDRVRRLERQLPHDRPLSTSASDLSSKRVETSSKPQQSPVSSVGSLPSFAQRLQEARERKAQR